MITATRELLTQLKNSQLLHTQTMIGECLKNGYGDDGCDYLQAALTLSDLLVRFDRDNDVDALNALLNTQDGNSSLNDFASDGICDAIYSLNPPALED